nr:MerR family transcriptional regulator [Blautia sp. NSJ-175]
MIPEVPRNASGIRNYDDAALNWIDFVMRFKKAGMALEAIREYVQLASEGESTI